MNVLPSRSDSAGDVVVANPWEFLRRYTSARIGLGRAGVSLPTRRHLEFQLAHAAARDAVYSELDVESELRDLRALGLGVIPLRSAAATRDVYLRRPDLGRRLDEESSSVLAEHVGDEASVFDAAFVVADGLSALAVQRHALPLLSIVVAALREREWRIAPFTVVQQGRVAIGDDIGFRLGAAISVVLIGERPGLSSPDSLGIYLTFGPRVGNTDADRNCISNIREAGLSYADAAHRLLFLMEAARNGGYSGVRLKDESFAADRVGADSRGNARNFLTDST